MFNYISKISNLRWQCPQISKREVNKPYIYQMCLIQVDASLAIQDLIPFRTRRVRHLEPCATLLCTGLRIVIGQDNWLLGHKKEPHETLL